MRYIEEHTNSNQSGVFFKIEDYQKICQALETLESIRTYNVPKNEDIEASPTLIELLDRATADKERITLTYQNQMFLAAIPIEETDLIEEIENVIDNKSVREALKEAKEKGTISSEELDKKLGW